VAQAVLLQVSPRRRCGRLLCFGQKSSAFSTPPPLASLSLADPLGAERWPSSPPRLCRGLMAPDPYLSVFHPALQANRLGEQVAEVFLLPVGHGPEGRPRERSVDEFDPCSAWRYTIRTAILAHPFAGSPL